ncbi:Uma2 family endonuclease [Azohydromonas aeria]|uniref:Uma2 family endonuclease n=1 Tax=Azohydromonas aeria TaxID=2590212 RepID=UPI0012FBF1C9|nr:Uma2 family endonuclease [Azohydromonas aeria]
MGLPQKSLAYITPDEYLALETQASTKHEYLDGAIYAWQGHGPQAMAGGTIRHNAVSMDISVSLLNQLRGRPCQVLMADVRLNLADRSAYFYPDVLVTCSPNDLARDDGVSEPCVVVEVLSPGTETFDRGEKFEAYRKIPSLQAYVLVSPDRRSIELFTRANGWQAQPVAEGEAVALGVMGLQLLPGEVFQRA